MQKRIDHNWDDIRIFLAVAREGTVSAAAEKLAVNQSTVSRRINAYEEYLKVRLFDRLSTGYVLTTEGEALQQHAERMEEESRSIERQVMGQNVALSGPIRVTTSLPLAKYVLMPLFAEFSRRHPQIEIQLDVSNNLYNISQREADVAIRVTRSMPPDNLVGRKLGGIKLGVYGRRDYVKQYTMQCKAAKKKNTTHPPLAWIGEDNTDTHPSWLGAKVEPLNLTMRTNEVLATIDAIKAGMGVGRVAIVFGDAEPELERIPETPSHPAVPVWILTHADMRRVSRVSIFLQFMTDEIRCALASADGKK